MCRGPMHLGVFLYVARCTPARARRGYAHRRGLGLAASGVAAFLALVSSAARADVTKAECIDANVKGQDLRRSDKLSAAREQLQRCADPSCPSIVRSDCTRRLDEPDQAQPTIVFEVKDSAGHDISAVHVVLDGKPLADRLTGAALQVDPGEHVFVFSAAGQRPTTQHYVIPEGQRNRHERVTLGGPLETGPTPASPSATSATSTPSAVPVSGSSTAAGSDEAAPPRHGMSTKKILGLTAAGVGLAGVATGAVFGLMTGAATRQQNVDCGSAASCDPHGHDLALTDHSNAMTYGMISTVGFIAGGALLATGAVLWFSGSDSNTPQQASVVGVPSFGAAGASVSVRGSF